jgi:hypothetical protein
MAGEGAVAQDLAERDEPTTQDDPQEPDTNGAEEDTPSDTKSSIDEMDREEDPDKNEDPDKDSLDFAPDPDQEDASHTRELVLTRDSCARRLGPFSIHGYLILTTQNLRFRPKGWLWGFLLPKWLVPITSIQPATGVSPDGAAMIWIEGNAYRFEGRGAVRVVGQVQAFLHELEEGGSVPERIIENFHGNRSKSTHSTGKKTPSRENLAANVRPSTDVLGLAKKLVFQTTGHSSFLARKCSIAKEGKNLVISVEAAPL